MGRIDGLAITRDRGAAGCAVGQETEGRSPHCGTTSGPPRRRRAAGPGPAAQPQQPAAQPTALRATPGASKPAAAAPALGKDPDRSEVVVRYCYTNLTLTCRKGSESFAAPGRAAYSVFGAGRLTCRQRPAPCRPLGPRGRLASPTFSRRAGP